MSHLSTYIHMRITTSEQKRWKQAAALRGQTLSELVRTAIEAELVTPVITARTGRASPSVSPHTPSARARAEKTLEERIQAIGELVDGLGVARPLPHPAEGDAGTVAASALERLLTD